MSFEVGSVHKSSYHSYESSKRSYNGRHSRGSSHTGSTHSYSQKRHSEYSSEALSPLPLSSKPFDNPFAQTRDIFDKPRTESAPRRIFAERNDNIKKRKDDTDDIVKKLFNCLYFHGTSEKSAKRIRKKGMKIEKKKDGCEKELSNLRGTKVEDKDSSQYHYFTIDKKEAAKYANMHQYPSIVRILLPSRKFSLKADPESDSKTAFRTRKDVRKYFVLPAEKEKLKLKNLNKILEILKLSPLNEDDKTSFNKIKDSLYQFADDKYLLETTKSFSQEESERTTTEFAVLTKKGIDLSTLVEGQDLSIDPDLLDELTS